MQTHPVIQLLESRCLFNVFSLSDAIARGVDANPDFISMADFNSDGKLDAIVSSYEATSLTVLAGRGNGTFVKPRFTALQWSPDFMAAGDLDNDSNVDLVLLSFAKNVVSVMRGDGKGSFTTADYPTSPGCRALVLADLDGDGFRDIALAKTQAKSLTILRNQGDGTFAAPVVATLGFTPTDLLAGDFNGDGKVDLAAAEYAQDKIHVLLNLGNLTFGVEATAYPTGSGPISIASGDFNQDGLVDLVTANFLGGGVTTLIGNGGGTFQQPTNIATASGATFVQASDLDKDGRDDLVVANANADSISLLRGIGIGAFDAPEHRYAGVSPRAIAVGDLNGDGLPDIAVTDQAQGIISVFSSDLTAPAATIASAPSISVSGGTSYTFTARFTDNLTMDVESVDDGDLVVSGPGGFSAAATFVGIVATGISEVIASYRIDAPQNFWTPADNGAYSISSATDAVFDSGGNGLPAKPIGSFTVDARDAGNTFALAMNLGKLQAGKIKMVDDAISPADRYDVFQFTLIKPARMYGKLSRLADDADLQLFDSAGRRIAYSKRTGSAAESFDLNLAGGTYSARVLFGRGSVGTGYQFRLETSAQTPPPSPDNTLRSARKLGAFTQKAPAIFSDYIGTDDPVDLLSFQLGKSATVQLKLSGLSDNADLAILDAKGTVIASSSRAGVANESLTRVLAKGLYFARITFMRGLRWSLYTLRAAAS